MKKKITSNTHMLQTLQHKLLIMVGYFLSNDIQPARTMNYLFPLIGNKFPKKY